MNKMNKKNIVTKSIIIFVLIALCCFIAKKAIDYFSFDKEIGGIAVPVPMLEIASEQGCDYEGKLRKALEGDQECIRIFATIRFFDGEWGYDHGRILIDMIERIGEDAFLSAIENCAEDEKCAIVQNIWVGFLYGRDNGVTLSSIFPKISDFIDKGKNNRDYIEKMSVIEDYYQIITSGNTVCFDSLFMEKLGAFYESTSYFEDVTNCKFHYSIVECIYPVYYDSAYYEDANYLKSWYEENKCSLYCD